MPSRCVEQRGLPLAFLLLNRPFCMSRLRTDLFVAEAESARSSVRPFAFGQHCGEPAAIVQRQGVAQRHSERFEHLGVNRFRVVGADSGANCGEQFAKVLRNKRLRFIAHTFGTQRSLVQIKSPRLFKPLLAMRLRKFTFDPAIGGSGLTPTMTPVCPALHCFSVPLGTI